MHLLDLNVFFSFLARCLFLLIIMYFTSVDCSREFCSTPYALVDYYFSENIKMRLISMFSLYCFLSSVHNSSPLSEACNTDMYTPSEKVT